jgi:phenylacetate-CoA ligase
VRGININHVEFEDFMLALAPINDFKCEAIRDDDDLDALRISVEVKHGASVADAVKLVEQETKRVFELTPAVVVLQPGALAREFEAAIKAPRIRDLRS